MNAQNILIAFLIFQTVQYLIERTLSSLNKQYYSDSQRQSEAAKVLDISSEDMSKTVDYTSDKYAFSKWTSVFSIFIKLAFIGLGGLGLFESIATDLAGIDSPIMTGLIFFGLIMLGSMLISLPLDYYRNFTIEAKHGYNRQTPKTFFIDKVKMFAIGVLLGAALLSLILWIMEVTGNTWWVWAWAAMSGFSLFAAWIYPAVLAPLFNKFTPVGDGELKAAIDNLAEKIGFKTAGIYIMDASKRSSHGNAYFTGVFGKKRIVLFDTLVDSMSPKEVVAVLAHELGHFKLNHVRWQLIRGTFTTGLIFYLLSLCLPLEVFYKAFAMQGPTNYGGLVVFGLWFGIIDFVMQPLESYLSRRNEFAADSFAREKVGNSSDLSHALLKLREKSNVMPLVHPLFSSFYHSHPPLLERLAALRAQG